MHTLTVGELRKMLEGYDDDIPILMAQQYDWPFEYSITQAVKVKTTLRNTNSYRGDEHSDEQDVLYLVEGQQLGYLSVNKNKVWT